MMPRFGNDKRKLVDTVDRTVTYGDKNLPQGGVALQQYQQDHPNMVTPRKVEIYSVTGEPNTYEIEYAQDMPGIQIIRGNYQGVIDISGPQQQKGLNTYTIKVEHDEPVKTIKKWLNDDCIRMIL
jgi:hypothetical protein